MNPAAADQSAIQGTLLRAWEELYGAADQERAAGLLQAVWPRADVDGWHRESLGERDACLLRLQSALFGPALQVHARCPHCGERAEATLDARAFAESAPVAAQERTAMELDEGGYRVRYRLPCGEDLQLLAASRPGPDDGIDSAVAALLSRCVLDARCDGRAIGVAELPGALVQRIGERMAEQDPLADLRLDLACPACGDAWTAALDIGAYLWSELDDWAQELLGEVDTLARHYGWSEPQVLALSPVRRRFYLDLVRS